MSEIKLDAAQRMEAELIIERIAQDEDALRDFVYAAIYYRDRLDAMDKK